MTTPGGRTLFVAENFPPDLGGVESFHLAVLSRIAAAARRDGVSAGTLLVPRRARDWIRATCPELEAAFAVPDVEAGGRSLPEACARFVATDRHDVVFQMRASRRFRETLRAAHRLGIPSLTYVHNLTPVFEQRCAAFRWRLRTSAHLCARVCTNSRYMVRQLAKVGHRPEHVEVVPLGVDTQRFAPPVARVPEPGPVLVTVGRLVGGKGHHRVLEVLPGLRAAFPGLRWLVVGDGPLRDELRAATARAGLEDTVEFVGALDDPRPALQRGDLFVLLAERETFGLAVLEAAAMGLPAVVLGGSGPEELIEQDVTGSVVEASPPAITAAIRSWLDQPERRRRAAIAARALAVRYDWADTTDRLLRILADVRRPAPGS
ncbi:MAG: glycosyltransferase [Planctomycetes bacterium]|nr:glycosyltransferase [Planctomycetota bacterium]